MTQQDEQPTDALAGDILDTLVAMMRRHDMERFEFEDDTTFLSVVLEPSPSETPSGALRTATGPTAAARSDVIARSPEMGRFMSEGISVGSTVNQHDVIGFVEVGPLRLPVRAPESGVLAHEYCNDGEAVGFHAPVFRITPASAP